MVGRQIIFMPLVNKSERGKGLDKEINIIVIDKLYPSWIFLSYFFGILNKRSLF